MGWGILEDPVMAKPPGTVLLEVNEIPENSGAGGIPCSKPHDTERSLPDLADVSTLKKDGEIVLQPQPSDSPNDPLNWSATWKNTIIIVLAFASGVTAALSPMVTPGLALLSQQFHVSLDEVSSWIIGFGSFWIGATTFFTAAGANIWGKRPFFFFSTVILFITNVWKFLATSFDSLAVMRVIQGMASAPLEMLVTSTASDLFFVHQRGRWLSMWVVMLGSGVLLGQIIAGFIIQSLGVAGTFGISAVIFIPIILAICFLVPETSYTKHRVEKNLEREKLGLGGNLRVAERKETYKEQMGLYRGRLSDESFWKAVVKPLFLIAYPAVLYSSVVYSSFFAWLVAFGVVGSAIFAAPSYNLTPSQISLINIPLFIVALIACPLAGWFTDMAAKSIAKRNKGVFEPEFRLVLMLIAAPISTAGLIGFGLSVKQQQPLVWPLFWMTLHSASVPFALQASLAYVIDCHPRDANQAFVTINFTKAVFVFVATTRINGFVAGSGVLTAFTAIAIINLSLSTLTTPSYIFGKRLRRMVAQSKLAKKLN